MTDDGRGCEGAREQHRERMPESKKDKDGSLDVKVWFVTDLKGEEVVAEDGLSGLGDAQPKVGGIVEGYTYNNRSRLL